MTLPLIICNLIILFPVWLRNRQISAGLEPVLESSLKLMCIFPPSPNISDGWVFIWVPQLLSGEVKSWHNYTPYLPQNKEVHSQQIFNLVCRCFYEMFICNNPLFYLNYVYCSYQCTSCKCTYLFKSSTVIFQCSCSTSFKPVAN